MLFRKKNVFALSWKNILALGLWEKISVFLSEENLEEKTQPASPTPPKNQMVLPNESFREDVWGIFVMQNNYTI